MDSPEKKEQIVIEPPMTYALLAIYGPRRLVDAPPLTMIQDFFQ